jgi:hypothetical protein
MSQKGHTQNTMSTPLHLPDRSPHNPPKTETSETNEDSKNEDPGGASRARPPSTYRSLEEGALGEGERTSNSALASSLNNSPGEKDAFAVAQLALTVAEKGGLP